MFGIDTREYRQVDLEMSKGWDPFVKPLIDFVIDNDGKVEQVKQKFGTLRFYYSKPEALFLENPPEDLVKLWDDFDEQVLEAERLSFVTCEMTGKPGKLRSNKRWLLVLCDEEAERLGYDRIATEFY